MSREMLLASIGAKRKNVPDVLTRADGMATGFGNHASDYPALTPPLPVFQQLLQNAHASQQLVQFRTAGAAKARDVQVDFLWTAMKSECGYVQTLVDASPSRGLSLIQNANLVVVTRQIYTKPLLALSLGAQSGTVNCRANIGLLMSAFTTKPNQQRCLNWQYTLDGGKSFLSAGTTPGSKTVLTGLPPLNVVGVRVCLNGYHSGVGAWTDVVTIIVH
jgi:hypothetical protein